MVDLIQLKGTERHVLDTFGLKDCQRQDHERRRANRHGCFSVHGLLVIESVRCQGGRALAPDTGSLNSGPVTPHPLDGAAVGAVRPRRRTKGPGRTVIRSGLSPSAMLPGRISAGRAGR